MASRPVLYDNAASSNAQKVRFLLAELGLAYDRREVPFARPRPEWYLAVNPRGLIPALGDGDLVLSESNAILRYLAARERRDDLYPMDDLVARARIDEFLDRLVTGLRGALSRHEVAALGYVRGVGWGAKPPDPEEAARVEEAIQDDLALLDGLLGERFTVLDRLTIADCALAPALARTRRTGLDLSRFARIASVREELLGRPTWEAVGATA
jgi:glutathione S-transferase